MKKTVLGFILTVLVTALLLSAAVYFNNTPHLNHYFDNNEIAFKIFGGTFLLVVFATAKLYFNSLDFCDDYTPVTVKISIINIVIWSVFWLCWCCFNLMLLFAYPFSFKLYLFSFLLTNGPAFVLFSFGFWMWLDELTDKDSIQLRNDLKASGEWAAVEKAYRFTYQSPLYGILTTPLFLIASALYYGL